MVSDVTVTGAATDAAKTQNAQLGLAADFNQFLSLLTTQLQNQDPLNPMDSAEFTNQLVQFSQVEQAINSNQKLDNLVNLQLASISSVALGYVGMDVMYRGADVTYDGTQDVKVAYSMASDAATAKVNIYNEAGELVFTDTAPKTTGFHEYVWDGTSKSGGKVPDGTYTIDIAASDSEGNPIETATAVSGRVRGIESQNGVIYTLIGDRAVPLGSIINATLPDTTPATTT